MRSPLRLSLLAVVVAGAVAMFAFPAVASAQNPTGHFNQGQGQTCTYGGTDTDGNLQSESVFCSGTVSGLGNEPVDVFVVIVADAGCANPGNPDIPGQTLRFLSQAFSPDEGGSVDYTVSGTVTCHGNQLAFIRSPVDLEAYACTSGRPRFNRDGVQTNTNCTLLDTEENVAVSP